jgi:FMN-dependent NADH-azoreductase
MATLLYIESSPRKTRSKSIAVANAFLGAYKRTHPDDQIVTIDLWGKKLPEFDGFTIDAKYQVLHGQGFSSEQHQAWKAVVDLCDEFKAADKYVLSLPMWNFGIPYKLKHYIDVIAQPGQTFSYDPATGYRGLVTGKPMTVIYARGGAYSSEEKKGSTSRRDISIFCWDLSDSRISNRLWSSQRWRLLRTSARRSPTRSLKSRCWRRRSEA